MFDVNEVWCVGDIEDEDLDLGNYERFMDIKLTRDNNMTTTGKIYQGVSHATDAIQEWAERLVDGKDGSPDICVKELGGTIGDFESMPFIGDFESLGLDCSDINHQFHKGVPHATDAIQEWAERIAAILVDGKDGSPDICVKELGGAIGDFESVPFIGDFESLGLDCSDINHQFHKARTRLDKIRNVIVQYYATVFGRMVFMIDKLWMKDSSPSILGPLSMLIIACFPVSIHAVDINAQPHDSTLKGNYTLKSFSHNSDELPPRTLSVEKNLVQGTTMLEWTDIIMFIGIVLMVVAVYYHKGVLSAFRVLWIHIIDLMQTLKIKIKQALIKLKKNNIEYLGRVFKLSNMAIASPFLGGAHKWKASAVAGVALFSIICYCAKVSVELKRSQVTTAVFFSELRNNKKVLFFTARHALEISNPLLFSVLACVYLTELDRKNHHMENDWLSFAFGLEVLIQVIGVLLIFMDDGNPDYFRQSDQNQLIPMQPVDTIPHKGNEIILKDKPVPEEFCEEGRDVNDLAVAQGCVENGASVSEMILEVAEELSEQAVDVHV